MVFPRRQPFTKRNLKAFFDACSNGKINTDEFELPDKSQNFERYLPNALKLTPKNYKDILEDLDKDKLVLIFDSSKEFDRGKKISVFFGKAAKRFHELNLEGKLSIYLEI